jgi:ppGpp synthetase/RelA/SpoT-type nucleotidyltranferase
VIPSAEMRRSAESFAAATASDLMAELRARLDDGPEQTLWLTWRVKSEESIAAKARRRSSHPIPSGHPTINDFIGLRVVLLHVGLVREAVTFICGWSSSRGLSLLSEYNFFVTPAKGQYRSIHLNFQLLRREAIRLDEGYGVEIQVTTYLQQLTGLLSHRYIYKHTENNADQDTKVHKIERISDQLNGIDLEVAELIRTRGS